MVILLQASDSHYRSLAGARETPDGQDSSNTGMVSLEEFGSFDHFVNL
jgi:hypothetical protein